MRNLKWERVHIIETWDRNKQLLQYMHIPCMQKK